jgi:two-component system, cell cycle sensor histidine kinase and response regulator CckA
MAQRTRGGAGPGAGGESARRPGPSPVGPTPPDAGGPADAGELPAAAPGRRRVPGQLRMTPFERAWLVEPPATAADPGPTRARVRRPAAVDAATVPLEAVAEAIAVVDAEGLIAEVNPALERLLGAPETALRGTRLDAWISAPPAADSAPSGPLAPPSPTPRRDAIGRRADGSEFPVDMSLAPVRGRDRSVATIRDASERRRLEQALQDNKDLTEQLRRSQKIGALGRLAGGVAHDFNNLLQVISGHAEALGSDALDAPARRRLFASIQSATDRAGSLTRQLLAFGRRQLLMPEVLDLNVTVLTLEQILTRVIGEDVQLVSALASDLRPVKVDPGQIEQVVLNLAINARDAMATGGTLEIATANFELQEPWAHPSLPVRVPQGSWVLLSVRDTGCGMDEDTAGQAFEPFFTTKDSTKGSGLGLSMVYGIVKQSDGYTWIDTSPGAGTAVHVLLPAVAAAVGPRRQRHDTLVQTTAPPAGATVLLVEDDPEVRSLFSRFLDKAGYAVIEAVDGRDALETFDARGVDIDVIITDVVMPNVSGPALVSALRARRPDIKVLYVSGYAEQLEATAATGPNATLLHKPVTRSMLVDEVAALLRGTLPS